MPSDQSILIVDDETEILETLRRRLLLEGVSVDLCADPVEALAKMETHLYPIVVSDIKMPGMTGIELLQATKNINPLCNVIMMTGYSSMANVVECLSNGAVDYFVKPFQDIDLVTEAIMQARHRTLRWRDSMATKTAGAR